MEGLDYQPKKEPKEMYPQKRWEIQNDNAIYNGYYIINIEEFKTLYNLYGHNATRVKKHMDKEGRRIPSEVFYSLRRFLGLPKFINTQGSWYDLSS